MSLKPESIFCRPVGCNQSQILPCPGVCWGYLRASCTCRRVLVIIPGEGLEAVNGDSPQPLVFDVLDNL